MERLLLSFVITSGLRAVPSHGGYQHRFVYEPMDLIEALSRCGAEHGHLATIASREDVRSLCQLVDKTRLDETGCTEAWARLDVDLESWTWLLSDSNSSGPGEMEFRKWHLNEPNNFGGREMCGQMSSGGLWNDLDCDSRLPAICSSNRGPNTTFVYASGARTWAEAQSYCRANHTDLASIRNEAEHQEAVRLVPSGQRPWIGLVREPMSWFNECESLLAFRSFAAQSHELQNLPLSETYMAVDFARDGNLRTSNCGEGRAFICWGEVVSKQVIRVSLRTNPSVDLSDPAVMEDMLEELGRRLKEEWWDGDFRLSWRQQADGEVFHRDEEEEV